MNEEKPLSQKIKYSLSNEVEFILLEDVKKALELLKELPIIDYEHIDEVNKIFGDFSEDNAKTNSDNNQGNNSKITKTLDSPGNAKTNDGGKDAKY